MFKKELGKPSPSDIKRFAHISTLSESEKAESDSDAADNGEASGDVNDEKQVNDYLPNGMKTGDRDGISAAPIRRIEHTDPVFPVVSRPDRQTMFDFMFYHSYMNVLGALSVIIGIGAITMVAISIFSDEPNSTQIILFGMVAVLFISNSPLTLWFKAKKQSELINDPKNTITYTFSDAGFDMSRGDEEYADFEWSHMVKVKEGKLGFYMYIEKNRAFVVPKADIPGSIAEFRSLIRRNVKKALLSTEEN